MMKLSLLLFLASVAMGSSMEANPIRKVVTLMQDMQKEIEAEGEKEKALYEKFVCYCDSTSSSLNGGIDTAKTKISEFSGKLEEDTAAKTTTDQELAQHKADREAAQNDLAQATGIRDKEAAEYQDRAADLTANLAAMGSAIPALEKGMGAGALLQMPQSGRFRRIVESSPDAFDRQTILAFLDQTGDYVPQSGQIVGILKNMVDEMQASKAEADSDEKKATAGYAELKAAKNQEVSVASAAIETKTKLAGDLAVSVVQNKDSLDDASAELADNEKFLAELKKQCADKATEWSARQSARAEEVQAISEAIGVLNDDDALDIFKKALPSTALISGVAKMGFLQSRQTTDSRLAKAQALIASSAQTYKNRNLELISYQMSSMSKLAQKSRTQVKQFDVVVKMIDRMTGILQKEQAGDEEHKAYCEKEFATSAKEKEANGVATDAASSSISELNDQISAIADDIATITAEINALDLSVAQATNQRKAEHAEYSESAALNEAAMSLIEKARQRLYKFYNPLLYKAPPKKELSMEDKIYASAGRNEFTEGGGAAAPAASLVQISSHRALQAPPPPPETFGAYTKKSEKSTGVLGLMDMIVKDLKNDMADAAHEEKTAQADYEALMAESATTRSQDAKSVTDKEKSKAGLETKLQAAKESKALTVEEAEQIAQVIADLHGSCDFLIENFDMRKEARTNELESLKNAKSVLAGASFSG